MSQSIRASVPNNGGTHEPATGRPRIGRRDLLIDTPRGRLFTRAWGERDCGKALEPIVLIHDSLGSVDLWRDFPSRLTASTGHPVIAYDRLGFGRSDEQRGKLETPGFVRQEALTSLPALRSTLDIDRMILLGHGLKAGSRLPSRTGPSTPIFVVFAAPFSPCMETAMTTVLAPIGNELPRSHRPPPTSCGSVSVATSRTVNKQTRC